MKNKATDISNPPDWDAMWEAAEIADGRNEEWRNVLKYRTQLPDDAIRLAGEGWTPELVVAARDNPSLYMTHATAREQYPDWAEVPASYAAKLMLADETVSYTHLTLPTNREV